MKLRLFVFLLLTLVLLLGCTKKPRVIVAEPLDKHDRENDLEYCLKYAEKYGVINMEPVMAGSIWQISPTITIRFSCMRPVCCAKDIVFNANGLKTDFHPAEEISYSGRPVFRATFSLFKKVL